MDTDSVDLDFLRRQQVSEIAIQIGLALFAVEQARLILQQQNNQQREWEQLQTDLRNKEASGQIPREEYIDAMANMSFPPSLPSLPIFFLLLSFLSHAAMVSKFLWPASSDVSGQTAARIGAENADSLRRLRKGQGKILRDALGVDDTWILKSRTLRNHMEHYDERLEEWWIAPKRHNVMDFSLMARPDVAGLDATDYHRVFDPRTGIFVFQNGDFDIGAMEQELRTLLGNAITWLDNHGDRGMTASLLNLRQ